ncbi:MAG: radical SAM protein, partial [Cyanobacteria bacterium NC_groundwater_1444_Ag_S-0.65um_54_12]|nr:radical SAM protein [Cyanobacteria bacterium NC_groundwater_1444_Ag_S-0.65um_54_12]
MITIPTIAFATLGCKTNQAETMQLLSQLSGELAVVPFEAGADIYVINSCTVTHAADRQSRQLIRRAHRANPRANILVTGCAVDYAAKDIQAIPGVHYVAPNSQKDQIASIIASWYGLDLSCRERPVAPAGIVTAGGQPAGQETGKGPAIPAGLVNTRAWLKISEGCNNHCAFCVIPRVRGPERSKPASELVERAIALSEAGYREIVLTGTNIGNYGCAGLSGLGSGARRGANRGSTLALLLHRLLETVPLVWRWRIGSLEPIDFPEALCELFSHPKLCPHIHLCLQSGSDRILQRMRRRYNV